jgi:predicted outer membrane repeat protein
MVIAAGAQGAIRYVSAYSGLDVNPGTAAAPCKTIQHAVDVSGSGDEIRIAKYDISGVFVTNTCVYTSATASVVTLPSGKSLSLKGGYIYIEAGAQWHQTAPPPLVDGQNARRCLVSLGGDSDTNHLELLEFARGSANTGACVYAVGGNVQLVGTPIHDGVASGAGGGLYMSGVKLSVTVGSYSNMAPPGLTGMLPIYSNSAAVGGGLFLDGGYPVLSTVAVINNTSTGNGGGIYVKGGMQSVVGGMVRANIAGGNGGGLYFTNSVARVGGMVISSNQACYGGAIALDGPFAFSMETATLIANNYIQNNSAVSNKGGAIYFNAANVGIINNMITGNNASNGAAAYLAGSSPRFFENTIADNIGSTAVYITHLPGAGSMLVTPAVTMFGRVVSPAITNLIAGIPVPSQPAFTNTILSGHATGLYIDSSGSSVLPNKVVLDYTVWWNNTVDTAGGGTINNLHTLAADPLFSSKGTAPNDMTSYHVATNSPVIDVGTQVSLSLPGTDLMVDIDAQLRPSGQGMDIGADEVVTDPFSVWFVPAALANTVTPGTTVTNQHRLLNSGTQNDTYLLAASNTLWTGSISPTNIVLNSQSYTSVTVIVRVPTNAANNSTNLTFITALSQTDTNRSALALDTTIASTDTNSAKTRYVWQSSPSPTAPYTSPDTAGHSIQEVVDVCAGGDTVWVYPGTYDTGGAVAPGSSLTNRVCITNAIAVIGISGATNTYIMGAADPATTNGPAAVRCLHVNTNAVISGFTLMGGHTLTSPAVVEALAGGGALLAGGAILSNCTIISCSANAWGGGLYGADTSVVWDTRIRACSAGVNGGGAYLADSAAMVNCLLFENTATKDGGGIYVTSVGSAYNCTIVSNAAAVEGGGLFANASAGVINDIIYFNSAQINTNLSKGTASIKNCCTTPDPGGIGIVTANPLFTDGNYHLQSNSPCIDQGSLDHAPSHDFDGNRRPLDGDGVGGAAYDIGCYEVYNPSGDSDGDGAKDGNEIIAGTDLLNGNDYFHIVALSNAPIVKVYFTASSNRSYSLEYGTNLLSSPWWVVSGQSNIPGKGPFDSLADSNAVGPARFYRLKVAAP